MPSIDLVLLGMVLEGPRSAYDIQKDVEYHHFSRWTRVSVPSVYRKILQLHQQGYLRREVVPGEKAAGKAVYSITESGRARFGALMEACAGEPVALPLDFNVVIANLNKLEGDEALRLVGRLRDSIAASARETEGYAAAYVGIPLVGRTIFDQQLGLYRALLDWLDGFAAQLRGICPHD